MVTSEELESMPRALREQYEAAHKDAALATAKPEPEAAETAQEPAPPVEDGTQDSQPAETNTEAERALKLEHSLRVLQGKYNAETARMRQQIADQERQIAEMRQQPAAKAQPETPEDRVKRYGLSEEEADFGDDAISLSEKVVDARLKDIKAEIETLRAKSAPADPPQDEGRSELPQEFFQILGSVAPSYERLNNDQGFLAWLNEYDPILGVQRDAAFKHAAYVDQDAPRVAAFFNEYERRAKKPAKTPSIANQVMPTTTGARPAPGELPTFTVAEIDEFMADVTRGKYPQGQAATRLAQIRAAFKDNRVRM